VKSICKSVFRSLLVAQENGMREIGIHGYEQIIDDGLSPRLNGGRKTKARQVSQRRRACMNYCGRRALFSFAGRVKWDHHHTLCFRCYRDERNRARIQTSNRAVRGQRSMKTNVEADCN
jgi:hypothetical protein